MKDPRIDVILANLNLLCKFHDGENWCLRAYEGVTFTDQPKYTHCNGQLTKCELTENSRIKPDDKDWGEE